MAIKAESRATHKTCRVAVHSLRHSDVLTLSMALLPPLPTALGERGFNMDS